jgi:restriction system protein
MDNSWQDARQRTGAGQFALRVWGLPEYNSPGSASKPHSAAVGKSRPTRLPAKAKSFTDAAEEILLHHANKRPMHYRAITNMALELNLIKTQGQTPEATLYAQILTEISRQTRRGVTPRFMKNGKGIVGLSRWMGSGLAYQIEQHNLQVRKKLQSHLLTNTPTDFEKLIGKLLVALGFEDVTVTGRSGDGGIDVRGTLVVGDVIRTRMAVQVKRWKGNVQAPTIQQVRGSLGTHEQGLIATTSDFSSGARSEAERPDAIPVALMNGDQLVALLVEHGIGIRRQSHDLIELGDADDD